MLRLFIKPFLNYCNRLCYAEKSVKELRRYIGAFNEFVNKQHLTEIRQVQYNHLLNFVTSSPATASTVKARMWTLKKFYGFLMGHSYIKDNIAAALIPPKIPKKETRFLSGDELKIIFDVLHKRLNQAHGLRDFVIIGLMATLGLRKGTVVALDGDDIDLQFGRIFIREKGHYQKRPSLIPLVVLELMQQYITAHHRSCGPLFISTRRRRLPADYVNKIVKHLKEELLAEGHDFAQHLHPHIFRHAAATQLYETGGIDLTRQVLGHRRIENSRRYIHLSPSFYGGYMKQHPYFRKERSRP